MDDDDDVLGVYCTPEMQVKRQAITQLKSVKRTRLHEDTSEVEFDRLISVPNNIASTQKSKFKERTNAGEIVASFGTTMQETEPSWKGSSLSCSVNYYDSTTTLPRYTYMHEPMQKRMNALCTRIRDVATRQSKHIGQPIVNVGETNDQKQAQLVIGKIWSKDLERMNSQSLFLDGLTEMGLDFPVQFITSKLNSYSFIPGQVVVAEGTYENTKRFIADKLYSDVIFDFPPNASVTANEDSLQIIVAAGPFTTSDNSSYQPFLDLLEYIAENQPDVCILIGPFVERIPSPEDDKDQLFNHDDMFRFLMKQLDDVINKYETKIVVVSSYRDLHHTHCVYPTPAYEPKYSKHVQFVCDPCLIEVEGIIIGMTSVDTLKHTGQKEIVFPPGSSDKLGRLARHILVQENFYPLYPPSQEMSVDLEHWQKYCHIPVKPHVLVLPSDLKCFIKEIEDCCCINPERLARGLIGGTFARLQIPLNAPKDNLLVTKMIAQVVKI